MIAIECRGIRKGYGIGDNRVEVLRGIDLEIYGGQLTILAGPSGSGKTTLLSILSTILTPDAGHISLLGQELSCLSADKRAQFCLHNLGLVFQSFFLIPTLSVVENVSLPLLIGGLSRPLAQQQALVMLKAMHLSQKAYVSPAILSKGQQQRVAIARAMVNKAKIIICDEPTSSLDQTAASEVMYLLKELALGQEMSVLVVTHDQRLYSFADRILAISNGQVIDYKA